MGAGAGFNQSSSEGGNVNPSNGVLPYNDNGAFSDSFISQSSGDLIIDTGSGDISINGENINLSCNETVYSNIREQLFVNVTNSSTFSSQLDLEFDTAGLRFNDIGTNAVSILQGNSERAFVQYTLGGVSGDLSVDENMAKSSHTTRVRLDAPKISLLQVPTYPNNAASLLGGLIAGDLYYTDVAGEYILKITH